MFERYGLIGIDILGLIIFVGIFAVAYSLSDAADLEMIKLLGRTPQ